MSTCPPTSSPLRYAITHVFLGVELPRKDDYTPQNELSLARLVCTAARDYSARVPEEVQWHFITKTLDNLQAFIQSEHVQLGHIQIISQLDKMRTGDTLAFFMRRQNAAAMLTKHENSMLYESFRLFSSSDPIKRIPGALICSYPLLAVEAPREVFDDEAFQVNLANFLCCPNRVHSNCCPPTSQSLTTLHASILRGIGHTVNVPRIRKRILTQDTSNGGWRRSSLWLLVRVAIQSSLDRSPLGCASYKRFILFFICTLAREKNVAGLGSDLLQLMACKILRRLSKFRSSTPDWLSELALKTCTCLGEILDTRQMQLHSRPSPFQNPSQSDLTRDTQLPLKHSRKYVHNALANPGHGSVFAPFLPSHRRRGTIEDFLSLDGSFFEEAYRVDPQTTLYDVENSIELGIDDWLAHVTDVDVACTQLEILMDKYIMRSTEEGQLQSPENPETASIIFLTAMELFIALDKLVLKEIPILADYPPEIPVAPLERLILRRAASLHRLSCVYQYLSARHAQSRPGLSVLSDAFDENSFPVRYYDQSPHLQSLKARIETEAIQNDTIHGGHQQVEGTVVFESLLPLSSVHAKVVIFELQCPLCLSAWRSSIPRILLRFCRTKHFPKWLGREKVNLLALDSSLHPYFIKPRRPKLSVEIDFAYSSGTMRLQSQSSPALRYVFQHGNSKFTQWQNARFTLLEFSHGDLLPNGGYVKNTSHTSNHVLAHQSQCPDGFSLDEFNDFGHLRSGGSLQWLNILRGVRTRTLNLRHQEVHYLISEAAFQVGPHDSSTGTWLWHQELQDPCFCNALLDELESLFVDVGASSIDGVLMNSISLLLTRMLASSPGEGISERAIELLRKVCRKTFEWVEELSYNLRMAPMNEERGKLLLEMAVTCRSTFDVDITTLRKLCHSAEAADALLSCALFIHTLRPTFSSNKYLQLLLHRDHRLSYTLEEVLNVVIPTNPSDRGIDLAVGKTFASYMPSIHRWEQLQSPNARWFTCNTEPTLDRPWQTIHLNLLDGDLRVDGQPVGGLPREIRESEKYQEIFRNQDFFVIPSSIPGMDFATLALESKRKVHFSLKDGELIVRAQCDQTGDVLELIPSRHLQQDLPPVLVENHLHWLNLATKAIEIRPLGQPLEESTDNWKVDCTSQEYYAYKGHEILVDVHSSTWKNVSKSFEGFNGVGKGPFESRISRSMDLLVTWSSVDSHGGVLARRLSVSLPHHGLSFFVNEEEELESHDLRDMVYDEDQCVGTLFGLKNIIVLRQKTHIAGNLIPENLIPRCVLIANFLQEEHGPFYCSINADRTLYYTYNVDTELGTLTGNGSMESTRYLAHLHANTSYHRPDPLTGNTGAQAAISLVQSGGSRSIMRMKSSYIRNLRKSAQLPQFDAACAKIEQGYYWKYDVYREDVLVLESEARAARRAAHLFTPASIGTATSDSFSSVQYINAAHASWQITLYLLLSSRPAPELPRRTPALFCKTRTRSSDDLLELRQLFASLPMNTSDRPFQQEYVALLESSTQHAREHPRICKSLENDRIDALEKYYVQCRSNYFAALGIFKKTLGPTFDPLEQALEQFGQWPSITADVLLRCLASTSPIKIPESWKKRLISLSLLLLDLQRARRLLRFALDGLEEEFSMELENEGCDGWNAEQHPDWLLIQIQGNFLIRRVQAETAMKMISPQSGGNTVTQVNMGEGKSSVIVPIAAAALADGKQLVRVVVPKALTLQMFDLLVARLGGLANRPIYHLPFSRSPERNIFGREVRCRIDYLRQLMSRCMAERGILLVQPEHIASLKLMSVEKQISKDDLASTSSTQHQDKIYKQVMTLASFPGECVVGNIYQQMCQSQNEKVVAPIRTGRQDGPVLDAGAADERVSDAGSSTDDVSDSGATFGGESDSDRSPDTVSKWASLQTWIHSHSRDILDESDEILHTRFQLNYTIGLRQHMDGYPDRWTIIQQVFRLMKQRLHTLSRNHPDSIEYECGTPGSFPHVRIIQPTEVSQRLMLLVVEDVMSGRLAGFNFQHLSPPLHDAIRSFISDEDVIQVPDTVKKVEDYVKGSHQSQLWNRLLLLRGLLACNILRFCLAQRRWRIDYGLDLQPSDESDFLPRTLLAVPYRAKDLPASNTQFGHPDITIILTCLAYYYTGLTEKQLRVSFEILLGQDDPSAEYVLWVDGYDDETLPSSLQRLSDLNLRSSEDWDRVVFPLFSRNQAAINFYLSQVVFPKGAKEFPLKLSVSCWDLAEKRARLVTGFSGTNDGRWLLPMSIAQQDLDHQQGANARVLAYLLRPENGSYMVTHESGERQSTLDFLQMVATQKPEIRVILDVGAQILDLSNYQLAEAWLKISNHSAGAIYFDENDELMVLTRNGIIQPMSSASLSQRLDRCVAYLDHAHTRGTDLKFPIGSRAAVTLGPKLTKDSLVQGCMRMRKLGHGHSVMFFTPLEVDRSIRAVTAKINRNTPVTTVDILCWAIHETWFDIQQRAPYWAQQGMNHKSRHEAWSSFCNGELAADKLAKVWLQPDTKSLADLYAPCEVKGDSTGLSALDPEIRQRCKTLGVLALPSANMEEEQEREVNREREREREVEIPPKAKAAKHSLHPDVTKLVKTGDISSLYTSSAFCPIFGTPEWSNPGTVIREAAVWSPSVLATADFYKTIEPIFTQGTVDQYLRPVQWILSCNKEDLRDQVLVLLSPFEVNRLMPDIRMSKHVHLHLYAPHASRRIKPSDDLRLFVIPPLPSDWTPPWILIDQLNMFAGQLYLRDYASYLRLCKIFGISPTAQRNQISVPGSFEENDSDSTLLCVGALLAIRNRGRPFAETHMGKILQGKPLTQEDFEVTGRNRVTWENVSSIECDAKGSAGILLHSSKRGLDEVDIDSESLRKRLRGGQ